PRRHGRAGRARCPPASPTRCPGRGGPPGTRCRSASRLESRLAHARILPRRPRGAPVTTFPPGGPLLLVSPHMDHAALSCHALLDREEPVDVLTVFAGRPDPPRQGDWDRACGFRDSSEATAARLEEERRALSGTAHRLSLLTLLESQHVEGP